MAIAFSGLLCAASGSMAVGDAYAAPAPAGSPVSTGSLGDLSAGITIGDVTIDPNPDQGTSVELSSADPRPARRSRSPAPDSPPING